MAEPVPTAGPDVKLRASRARLVGWALAHPGLAAFAVAALLRGLVATGLTLAVEGPVFGDDYFYWALARRIALGSVAMGADESSADARNAAFIWPLVVLYRVFGPRELVAPLWAALMGSLTAGFTAITAARAAGPRAGLVAGGVVALLPSVVLWSSITLKDSSVWAVLAAMAAVAAAASDAHRRRLLGLGALAGLLALLMGYLRWHTLIVLSLALVFAALLGPRNGRLARTGGAALLALVVPMAIGIGPLGIDFVRSVGSLEERRQANAEHAATAFVDPSDHIAGAFGPGGSASPTPSVRAGKEANVPPQEVWFRPVGAGADLQALPRGVSVMLLEPYPWDRVRNNSMRMAQIENVLWYPVLALALVGLRDAWRRRSHVIFPLAAWAGLMVLYALVEGNFGTAFRHRAEFVWAVAIMAGVGLARLLDRRWPESEGRSE